MPTRSLVDELFELPVLRRLPGKPILMRGTELLLLIALFLVLRWIVARLVDRAIDAVVAREAAVGNAARAARVRTLASLAKSVLFYALAFIVVIMAFGILGLNVTGALGTASVVGLAVGFGAQKLVKDVITGFFILLEDQYAVGDYVTIGAVTGTVEELGMRITRIRDEDGRLYILPNGDIGQVCNQSRGPIGGVLEVAIAASADIAKATQTLNAALAPASEELGLAQPARVDGIAAADSGKTVLRIRFHAAAAQRPGNIALRLRETAHAALRSGQIPLA